MPADSSLVTFRVSQEDHDLLRAVANYRGESLSAFVRDSALAHARQLIADIGPEVVIEGHREREVERQSKAAQRLAEGLSNIRRIAQTEDDSDSVGHPRRPT